MTLFPLPKTHLQRARDVVPDPDFDHDPVTTDDSELQNSGLLVPESGSFDDDDDIEILHESLSEPVDIKPPPVFIKPSRPISSTDSTEKAIIAIRGSTLASLTSGIERHNFGIVEKKDTLAAKEVYGPMRRHTVTVPEMISRKEVPRIEIVSDGSIPFIVVTKRHGTYTPWMPPNYNVFTRVINKISNRLLKQKNSVALVLRAARKWEGYGVVDLRSSSVPELSAWRIALANEEIEGYIFNCFPQCRMA